MNRKNLVKPARTQTFNFTVFLVLILHFRIVKHSVYFFVNMKLSVLFKIFNLFFKGGLYCLFLAKFFCKLYKKKIRVKDKIIFLFIVRIKLMLIFYYFIQIIGKKPAFNRSRFVQGFCPAVVG